MPDLRPAGVSRFVIHAESSGVAHDSEIFRFEISAVIPTVHQEADPMIISKIRGAMADALDGVIRSTQVYCGVTMYELELKCDKIVGHMPMVHRDSRYNVSWPD
jgi:hypothetical protein